MPNIPSACLALIPSSQKSHDGMDLHQDMYSVNIYEIHRKFKLWEKFNQNDDKDSECHSFSFKISLTVVHDHQPN